MVVTIVLNVFVAIAFIVLVQIFSTKQFQFVMIGT